MDLGYKAQTSFTEKISTVHTLVFQDSNREANAYEMLEFKVTRSSLGRVCSYPTMK